MTDERERAELIERCKGLSAYILRGTELGRRAIMGENLDTIIAALDYVAALAQPVEPLAGALSLKTTDQQCANAEQLWPQTIVQNLLADRKTLLSERDDAYENCAELYQVIGSLSSSAGVFDHPDVIRALDNASRHEDRPHKDLLPWPREPLQCTGYDEGHAAGIEEAAQWHDFQAKQYPANPTRAQWHENAATTLRALKDKSNSAEEENGNEST